MARQKEALGMGMDALFMENDTKATRSQKLRLTEISPNKAQPRRDFDDSALETLADSIKQHGVLQPILVRPLPMGGYQIVAGERRWRASRLAGLDEIPVFIRELTDSEAARIAMVENLQREDLNPIEEAQGYRSLMEETGATQDEIAKVVGKSRSAVANSLRLLGLDEKCMELTKNGGISPGHARALLAVEDVSERNELAKKIVKEELSVRQTEALVKSLSSQPSQPKQPKSKKRESYFREIELALKDSIGRVCTVKENKAGGGMFSIEFYDREDLAEIAKLLERIQSKNNG